MTVTAPSPIDRLSAEFEDRLPRATVSAVMHGCVEDLSGVPPPAMPELSERLARQRLTDYLERGPEK